MTETPIIHTAERPRGKSQIPKLQIPKQTPILKLQLFGWILRPTTRSRFVLKF